MQSKPSSTNLGFFQEHSYKLVAKNWRIKPTLYYYMNMATAKEYHQKFLKQIKSLSVHPEDWLEEWTPNAMVLQQEGYCICGKDIQWHYGVTNDLNGNSIWVGCDCLLHFFNPSLICKCCGVGLNNKAKRLKEKNFWCRSCKHKMTKALDLAFPFGKFKGLPIGQVVQDKEYCKWLLTTDYFKQNFAGYYSIIYNLTNESIPLN